MRVAECEHIKKAANDCYMTQPALSRIITQLETELGAKLFDREGRSLKLNDSGRVVYDCAAGLMKSLQDVQEQLDALNSGRTGCIHFATTFPSYEDDWIGSCVCTFLANHPSVQFSQIIQSSYSLRDSLLARDVDIVISDQPIVDSAIEWKEIFSEPLGVVMSSEHPLSCRPLLSIKDLNDCEFYCNNDNGRGKDLATAICEKAGFQPKIRFRGNYPHFIDQAISTGLGVSLITEGAFLAGQARHSRQNIIFRPIQEEYCRRTYGMALLHSRTFPKVTQDFIDILLRCDVAAHRKELVQSLMNNAP